jgi:hypothetical protein
MKRRRGVGGKATPTNMSYVFHGDHWTIVHSEILEGLFQEGRNRKFPDDFSVTGTVPEK